MEWWGYGKEHGWVVLDRSIACNEPGLKENLLFFRCRDTTTFIEKRKNWNPPLYRYAPNYIRDLAPAASAEAATELETYQSLWPEYQRQMQKDLKEAEDRAENERAELEKQQKSLAKEKK